MAAAEHSIDIRAEVSERAAAEQQSSDPIVKFLREKLLGFASEDNGQSQGESCKIFKVRDGGRDSSTYTPPKLKEVEAAVKFKQDLIQRSRNDQQGYAKMRYSAGVGMDRTYIPKHVSIGPYHYRDDRLKDMQEVKFKYLADLIKRCHSDPLKEYVKIVWNKAEDAKTKYSAGVGMDHEEFVKMLVLDGCFIIEFLVKLYLNDRHSQVKEVHANLPAIQTDLLLVENQIPFDILQALFEASQIPAFNTKVQKKDEGEPFQKFKTKVQMKDEASNEVEKKDKAKALIELVLVCFGTDRRDADKIAERFIHGKYSLTLTRHDQSPTPTPTPTLHHLLHLFHALLDPKYHKHMDIGQWLKRAIKTIILFAFLFYIPILGWIVIIVVLPFVLLLCISSIIYGIIQKIFQYIFSSIRWSMKTLWSCIMKIGGCIKIILCLSSTTQDHRQCPVGIPSTKYLRDTGFKFKAKEATSCYLDVTRSGRTIKIPVLSLDESTCILFKNLLAFEQYSLKDYGNRFTAFATFMDYLIDTEEDVAILRECGIINSRENDDAMIAGFFNNLCRGAYFEIEGEHYLSHIFNYVKNHYMRHYYQVQFYQWRKKFVPDYFTNPWAIPSMIAAGFLLVLTVVQTFYTIYPYYHPRS